MSKMGIRLFDEHQESNRSYFYHETGQTQNRDILRELMGKKFLQKV